jgi:hypothetical protein
VPGADDKSKEDKNKNGSGNPGDETDPNKAKGVQDDAGGENNNNYDQLDVEESELSEKTKKYLQKLRGENAKHRTKAKESEGKVSKLESDIASLKKGLKSALGIQDDEDVDPAQEVEALKGTNASLALNSAIAESAIEHGIPKEHYGYFRFLMSEQVGALKDGEDLTEEQVSKIVGEVKALGGVKKASTGVGGGSGNGGGNPPPAGGGGEVTVEQFKKMSTLEQTLLLEKNPQLYERLRKEAYK